MRVFLLALAVVAWLVLCWLALVFLSVPLTLIGLAAGTLLGVILAAIGYLRVYAGREDEQVLAKPAGAPERGPRPPDRRAGAPYPSWDDAWPSYLSGQVERDIVAAAGWPAGVVGLLWWETVQWVRARPGMVAAVPPIVPPPIGFLVGVTAGTCGGWVALAVAAEAAMAMPRAARLAAIGLLRASDASARWWYGAAATCPRCHWVTRLPAYRCSGDACTAVHRDLRPGRLGVLCHRCRCGERLPTTMFRAARKLAPACPACDQTLHDRAGVTPDARIALSGGPAAGKTQLLMWATSVMTDGVGAPWGPADDHSTIWLRNARNLLDKRPIRRPERTVEPLLLTFRDSKRPRQRYVHIADIGGQYFRTEANDPAMRHFGTTRRHVLVLDATTIPAVRDRIGPAVLTCRVANRSNQGPLGSTASAAAMELPYHLLVGQLNRFGARTRRCSLAVVVTRADLLAAQGMRLDSGPAGSSRSLRTWLREKELHNLVEAAEHDFAAVQYFAVGDDPDCMNPAAPFAWLLARHCRGAATP